MDILSVVWNWDPTLVTLGNLDIRWYGLMWAIAILVAERICNYTFSREGNHYRIWEPRQLSHFYHYQLNTQNFRDDGRC